MRRTRLRLSRVVSLALAVMLVVPTFAPMTASAASPFTGGPDQDPPIYVLNDHTAYAVHFTATGLEPGATYYIKARFTVGTSPSGTSNQGFTWNPTTSSWVQEREPVWGAFPTATADASGMITANAGWVWVKFGDERKSGPYYIMISLNQSSGTQTGTTFNSDAPTPVTVLDAKSQGAWFHNGIATGIKAATRAEVTAVDTTTTVYALSKTETNTVDDDANGFVDDEDYGPAGKTGDWRLGVPAEMTADVFLNRQKKFDDTSTPAADTEISLGAADMSAPTSPTSLGATPGTRKITLEWNAATDDNTVASYRIYRWAETSATTFSTPLHELIGTTAGTTFEDASPTLGATEWSYDVRAVDTSENVSARSDTATGTALLPTATAQVTPAIPYGLLGWYKTAPTIELMTGPGTTGVEYSWVSNAGPWAAYSDELSAPEGMSTLYFRGTDAQGAGEVSSIDLKVDSKAPTGATVSVPAVSSDVSASFSFPVKWTASDPTPGAGKALYNVQRIRKPGYTSTLTTTAATSFTMTGDDGATYYFRTRAMDAAGNWSQWSTMRSTTIPYNESLGKFSSGWTLSKANSYWLGTEKFTKTKNAWASFGFSNGNGVGLVLTKGPGRGKAAVYVDGKYVKTVDTYSATYKARQYFGIKSFTTGGSHTVKIVNLATSGRSRIDLDGFVVKR